MVDPGAGRVVAQPTAPPASATSSAASARRRTRLPARGLERSFAQLMSGHPVSQLCARLFSVPLAENVAQIGHERERIRVLLGMAARRAEVVARPPHQRALV